MNDSATARLIMLVVMVAALVSTVLNVVLRGAPGAAVFAVADLPWALLLPPFRDDYLPGIGITFGLFWPLLLAGLVIIAVNRALPEKWRRAAPWYRLAWLSVTSVGSSVVLALPFHLYGLWMTHRDYASWTVTPLTA